MKSIFSKIVLMAVLIISVVGCSDDEGSPYRIKKGDLTVSIMETGELAAVNTRSFILPRYGRYWYRMKVIGLLEHGAKVEAGDSVIQLDPSEITKFILDRETRLETQKANLEKLVVNQANQKDEFESTLRSEKAAFDLKKLEQEYSKFETEKNRKIKELQFKQAEINLKKVQNRIEQNKIIARNDLKIQKLRVSQLKDEIDNAVSILPKLTIRTPIPGIFQVAWNRRTNSNLKIGDEIYNGRSMGNVPDLTWMKVYTVVNETDFLKVKEGQKVIVRLDALPKVIFDGEISSISKLCRRVNNTTKQKVFDVEVKLLVSDERLKPGMTVSCEYICDELEDVMYAPLNCISTIDGESFIYINKNGKNKKVEVELGAKNNVNAVIKGDFKKGTKLTPIVELNQDED